MTTIQRELRLAGHEIALTGRLSSMRRDEAIAHIETLGGSYAALPSETTTLVVVGQDGTPLGEDGRLTHALRTARALRDSGHTLRIIDEHEWLALLGFEDRQEDLHRLYTPEQLHRILGLPAARIRAWVRHGLIQPARRIGRLPLFDFPQVTSLKALRQLLESGVSPARLRRSLEQLESCVSGAAHSLAQLESLESEAGLVVRLEDGSLMEPSGQLRFDYDESPLPVQAPTHSLHDAPRTVQDWFELALRAEDRGDLDQSIQAYERALELNGPSAEISFNLGNALYSAGHKSTAAERFLDAARLEPDYVEAWNNLGNALADLDQLDDAISAYRRALAIAPNYADAHYNIGETLATRREYKLARRHWLAYLEQDPSSAWAQKVRARLDGLPTNP